MQKQNKFIQQQQKQQIERSQKIPSNNPKTEKNLAVNRNIINKIPKSISDNQSYQLPNNYHKEFQSEIPNQTMTQYHQMKQNQMQKKPSNIKGLQNERKLKESSSFSSLSASVSSASSLTSNVQTINTSKRLLKSQSNNMIENNSNIMPVVEEGMSNDELENDNYYDNSNEQNDDVLVEYNSNYEEYGLYIF
jgi:hypothetical protein